MRHRRALTLLASLVALSAALFGGASVTLAHAIIVRTDPVDGATLAEAPQQVRLWFSEPVALSLTTIELIDGDGQRVPVTAVRWDGVVDQSSSESLGALVIDLPRLEPNAYRLTWWTLSNEDAHVASGSIVFGVQILAEITSAPVAVTAPPAIEVALRWLNFTALSLLVGALVIALVALPADDPKSIIIDIPQFPWLVHKTRLRLMWLALGATLLALIVGLGLLLAQAMVASGIPGSLAETAWQMIAQTSYGERWLLREGQLVALVLVIGVILFRARRCRDESEQNDVIRTARWAMTPIMLALVVLQALNGHASGFNDFSLVRVIAEAIHLLAASVWAGGLLALVVTIVPLLRRGSFGTALARTILRRFSRLAAASLAILLITGLYNSGQQVASLDALLTTPYGQSLLLKVTLALAVAFLGLLNASILHPGVADALRRLLRRPQGWNLIGPEHLSRTIALEATGAMVALLLVAVLSA